MSNLVMCITLIGISIFCCSCHRDCPVPVPTICVPHEAITSLDTGFYVWTSGKEKDGFATAIKLNKEWRASAQGYNYNNENYSILLTTYLLIPNEPWQEYKKEEMTMNFSKLDSIFCLSAKSIPTQDHSWFSYNAVDYDAGEDRYTLDESTDNNYLQIDTLNVETGRMAGKFMATFRRLTNNRPWNLPTVRFFNGEFHCNIVN